ncbi:MAG: MerR family transcriptional regulator [Lachnospiraceae bacterium]|jgi:DNA-binding transcriptional MerR regulator|nr:MerR family transcriptional regulator [Lachnospiraceae bacterium]
MRTVKEISNFTGISVRTLHYYHEIGLLLPTAVSEAGYRLYDDKALETLRQILFFREFDMPLKEIQKILGSPDFDREKILRSQRKMLELKKERLNRMIAGIDDILKGEEAMDFTVFRTQDIEEICEAAFANMSREQQEIAAEQYGGQEEFQKHLVESMSTEQAQKTMSKMLEWYGDKETYMDVAVHPLSAQVTEAYGKRFDAIRKKLAGKRGTDVNSFEVKEIVGEFEFAAKQLFRLKNMEGFMMEMAKDYRKNQALREHLDQTEGEGTADYLADALEAFYKR